MPRRKTNKEFIADLNRKMPGYTPLEKYQGGDTKIKFRCPNGHVYSAKPSSLMEGHGCKQCAINARTMTNEEFVRRLHGIFPQYKVLEKYQNNYTKIKVQCANGHVYKTAPGNILRGKACKQCLANSLRKSNEDFVKELKKRNPQITPLENYKTSSTKIKVQCSNGHTFFSTPGHLLNGRGCMQCAIEAKFLTNEEFVKKIKEAYPNITLLEKYKDSKTKIKARCSKGHIFSVRPDGFFAKTKTNVCPYCSGYKKSHEQFLSELKEVLPDYKSLEEYINQDTEIKVQCPEGHIFKKTPVLLLGGTGCPICSYESIYSRGERRIAYWLKKYHIRYQMSFSPQTCIASDTGYRLRYDFKVNDTLIEFQGKQHYEPIDYFGGRLQFQKQQEHDKIKREWAKDNGFVEVEICYNENIEEKLTKIFNKVG